MLFNPKKKIFKRAFLKKILFLLMSITSFTTLELSSATSQKKSSLKKIFSKEKKSPSGASNTPKKKSQQEEQKKVTVLKKIKQKIKNTKTNILNSWASPTKTQSKTNNNQKTKNIPKKITPKQLEKQLIKLKKDRKKLHNDLAYITQYSKNHDDKNEKQKLQNFKKEKAKQLLDLENAILKTEFDIPSIAKHDHKKKPLFEAKKELISKLQKNFSENRDLEITGANVKDILQNDEAIKEKMGKDISASVSKYYGENSLARDIHNSTELLNLYKNSLEFLLTPNMRRDTKIPRRITNDIENFLKNDKS